jgi:hypothetical protein
MQKFYVDAAGKYIGSYLGPDDSTPIMFAECVSVQRPPDDDRQVYNFVTGDYDPAPPEFKPIEPTPFWTAARQLLGLKKGDVLASIADEDERYDTELAIEGRKTYLRDDPFVVDLATALGYPPIQMDTLWLYVQTNYK